MCNFVASPCRGEGVDENRCCLGRWSGPERNQRPWVARSRKVGRTVDVGQDEVVCVECGGPGGKEPLAAVMWRDAETLDGRKGSLLPS